MGGGVANNGGRLQITGGVIQGNWANDGAGIQSNGALVLERTQIRSNTAQATGGGIYCSGGTCNVARTTFFGNGAAQAGGGLRIYVSASDVTIDSSTFSTNSGGSKGGAIFNDGGPLTVFNSTFAGNEATNASVLYNGAEHAPPNTYLKQVTVAGNLASGGGALANGGGLLAIAGSLFDDNTPANCDTAGQPVTTGGKNVASDLSCNFSGASDLRGVAVHLGPLGDHGGPTQTMVPQFGSPAINFAVCLGLAPIDQRGVDRPQGSACDAGAVEVMPGQDLTSHALYLALLRK